MPAAPIPIFDFKRTRIAKDHAHARTTAPNAINPMEQIHRETERTDFQTFGCKGGYRGLFIYTRVQGRYPMTNHTHAKKYYKKIILEKIKENFTAI